jgi:hypothetical protein
VHQACAVVVLCSPCLRQQRPPRACAFTLFHSDIAQLCPLKTATRLSRALPGLRGLGDDDIIDKLAGTPVNMGGALILLASDSVEEAATIQKALCQTLLYPQAKCRFNVTSSTDPFGPLHYYLDTKDRVLVSDWLTRTVTPLALKPMGQGLTLMPDALCKAPVESLINMPPSIKFQLVGVGEPPLR